MDIPLIAWLSILVFGISCWFDAWWTRRNVNKRLLEYILEKPWGYMSNIADDMFKLAEKIDASFRFHDWEMIGEDIEDVEYESLLDWSKELRERAKDLEGYRHDLIREARDLMKERERDVSKN